MHRRKLLVAARERKGLSRLDRLFGAVGIEIDVHGSPYLAEFAVALIKHNTRDGDVGVAPRPHKPAATPGFSAARRSAPAVRRRSRARLRARRGAPTHRS